MIFACAAHVNDSQTVNAACVTLYCSHENAYGRPHLLCHRRDLGCGSGAYSEAYLAAVVEDPDRASAREPPAYGRVSGEHSD